MTNGFTEADFSVVYNAFTPEFFVEEVDACGEVPAGTLKGVWYQIQGTGSMFVVETCSSDFDTQIRVFQEDCSNSPLTCVAGNDNSADICGDESSGAAVLWPSTIDVTYSIFVCE